MNRKKTVLMQAFSLIMSAIWAQAVPLPTYSVKDIGFLPGFTQMTGAAINIKGDIVGTAYTGLQQNGGYTLPGHGFLYHGGKLTDLGAGEAIAINASREVLGNTFDPSSHLYTVFLYMNGKFTRLPNTYATDLNDLGQVLIYSDIGVAQIRQPNGEIVSYPIADPNINLFGALALNDLGQVIGREFVYPYGSNDLDFLNNVILVQPGGSYRIITNGGVDNYCFPVAMNILGQAVGHNYNLYWDNYYQNAFYDNGHAMLYNPDGQAVVLGNLFPGTTPEGTTSGSAAYGINSFGAIVGSCRSVFNGDERAFLYLNGTMYDINTLVNASGQGLTITEARGINDLGQIVALAKDSAGNTHTVLLSVVGFKGFDALK